LQTTRASSVSFPLIAGCLNGLTEFLYSFSQSPEDSPENCRRIYTYVKKLSEPGQGRRVAQRAALNLVSIHGCQLSQHLYKDYQLWHETLLKWLALGDKDCKVAIKALDSFYRQIARTLNESKHGNEQAVFQVGLILYLSNIPLPAIFKIKETNTFHS
ncbi:unnamed protein product, partial [Timema podura]|nr:unnamed protein product [Timema podura]